MNPNDQGKRKDAVETDQPYREEAEGQNDRAQSDAAAERKRQPDEGKTTQRTE